MSRATLEQDKKKTRAKDGPGAETDRKEREEYGEETDELEDDVPQGGRMSLLAHLNELRRRLTICAVCFLVGVGTLPEPGGVVHQPAALPGRELLLCVHRTG